MTAANLADLMAEVRGRAAEIAAAPETAPPDRAARLIDLYDTAVAAAHGLLPPAQPPACAKGCSYCCHFRVRTDPSTARRVAAVMAATWHRADIAAWQTRAHAFITFHGARSTAAVPCKAPPCPFLADRACSIHAVRPIACRAMNSDRLDACLKAFTGRRGAADDIPGWGPAQAIDRAIAAGIGDKVELVPAVIDALLDLTSRAEPAAEEVDPPPSAS